MPATMATTLNDRALGKVIFTSHAATRMRRYGLTTFHILETLKHGQVTSSVSKYRFSHLVWEHDLFKHIEVVAATNTTTEPPGQCILVTSCWAIPWLTLQSQHTGQIRNRGGETAI